MWVSADSRRSTCLSWSTSRSKVTPLVVTTWMDMSMPYGPWKTASKNPSTGFRTRIQLRGGTRLNRPWESS